MTGAIPSYGANFKLVRADRWHPVYAQRMYAWRGDTDYYIRADHTSKQWRVFHRGMEISGVFYSLTSAMNGFLTAADALHLKDDRALTIDTGRKGNRNTKRENQS